MSNNVLTQNILAVLKERDISQKRFTEMAGIDRTTWYNVKNGSDVRLSTICMMSAALKLKPATLMRGVE